MKIYISAAREEKHKAAELAAELHRAGHTIADKWYELDLPPTDEGEEWLTAARIARRQIDAIEDSDLLVYFSPPIGMGRGCHIELGFAMGLGIETHIIGKRPLRSNFEECATRYDDAQEFLTELSGRVFENEFRND